MNRRTFLLTAVLLCLPLAALSAQTRRRANPRAQATPAAQAARGEVYGMIEIGAKGVKAFLIKVGQPDMRSEDPPVEVVQSFEPSNQDAFAGGLTAPAVRAAVTDLRARMIDQHRVPADRIFVAGSSGIPEEVRTTLERAFESESFKFEFITSTKESTLVFKGIVPPWRYNINEVVVLDIGSGNTKGAYLTRRGSLREQEFANFAVKWGTGTFAKGVLAQKKDGDFLAAAEPLLAAEIARPVQADAERLPGMRRCTRLYLAGGICWTMATLMRPELIGTNESGREVNWVQLTQGDVNRFVRLATTNPAALYEIDYSQVRPQNRERAKEEVAKVGRTFTQEQVMAGALILKTYLNEMQRERPKAAIFFSRRAISAWPMGFVLEKAGGT